MTPCPPRPAAPEPTEADRAGFEESERSPTELLTGWGRTAPTAAVVARPEGLSRLEQLITRPEPVGSPPSVLPGTGAHPDRGGRGPFIARGLGRSYGDAAQCAGGIVVDTSAFDRIHRVDPATGTVVVGGGARLGELMRHVLLRGWFVPVTPGTRHVTVGGAIAADIHGKNHHRDGSIGRHLRNLTVATPSGAHVVGPDDDTELFWATVGGMGLTGVVIEATLKLIPVESEWMLVDTHRYEDLEDLMSTMESTDDRHRYSVGWVDCSYHRGHLGRSVLTTGDHAPEAALPRGRRPTNRGQPWKNRLGVPTSMPGGLVTRRTVRLFNDAWYRRSPRSETGAVRSIGSFFHPLDGVANWNRLYGPAGFVQYQFVVGPQNGEIVRQAVAAISLSGVPSFMGVLKRFGPGDPGILSFPMEGWTLAVDFPVGPIGLPSLLDGLDELVAGAGGRVYLAKDARLRPEFVPVMYPRLDELADVRQRVDPLGLVQSDLSRRLGITGAAW